MPINKDFEFYELFNYQILKIKESGILDYIQKVYQTKYGGIIRQCENSKRQKGSPIDPYTVIAPIIVFLGGLSVCFLILMVENCWSFSKKRKEEENSEELFSTRTDVSPSSQLGVGIKLETLSME